MYCSVGGTFTWQVIEALGKVRKAVARVEHMLQDRADQYMEQQELGIKQLLVNFVTLYTTKVKEGRWTPARGPVDGGAIRSANVVSDEGQVAAVCEYMINTLQANHSGSRDQSVRSNTK